MMPLEKYMGSLLPNFESTRITNNLNAVRDEFKNTVLPVYKSTNDAFKATTFTVPENKVFTDDAKKYFKGYKNSVHDTIYKALLKVDDTMDVLEELTKEHFDRQVSTGSLTYTRVNLLQMGEVMGFTAMYARRLLLTMYSLEATPFEERLKERAFLKEINWLRTGSEAFYRCLTIVSMKEREVRSKFKATEDLLVIPGEIKNTSAVIGASKVDPMGTAFISATWNPIYHLRMAIANWQHVKYETAIAEKEAIELHLVQLRDLRNSKGSNPKVTKQIEYNEGRLNKLRKKLSDMEDDARDD